MPSNTNIKNPIVFGHYNSSPQVYSFYGQPGWYSCPSGYSWYIAIDKGQQMWVSPNPLTKNPDGSVSGNPMYAAETNADGTIVFQNESWTRKLGIDSPPPTWLSENVS